MDGLIDAQLPRIVTFLILTELPSMWVVVSASGMEY